MESNINSENKYKRLFKDTSLFAIGGFASKILLFLLTPLYTSLLATEEFGLADLITTTISLLFPILTLAITDATLRFAINRGSDKESVLANSLVIIAVSCIFIILLYPLAHFIGDSSFTLETHWNYFVIIYALSSFHDCFANYTKAIGKTKVFAIQGIVQTVFLILSNLVLLLWLRMGIGGYLLSVVISHVPPILIMVFFTGLHRNITKLKINFVLFKSMLLYSMPLIPAVVSWIINMSIDKYMIIHWYGMGENGIYSIAHKIPTIITTIITFFINAWTLSSIQNHGSDDESEYTTKLYNVLFFLLSVGCMGVILFDKFLSKILFASDYYVAWKYVPFLTISAIFSALSGFLAGPYRAAKKTISLLVSVIIGAIVNISLNIVLLNTVGVIGAAIATAISFFIVWIIRIIIVQRIVIIKPQIFVTLFTIVCITVSALLTIYDYKYALFINSGILLVLLLINYKNIVEMFKLVGILFKKKGESSRTS